MRSSLFSCFCVTMALIATARPAYAAREPARYMLFDHRGQALPSDTPVTSRSPLRFLDGLSVHGLTMTESSDAAAFEQWLKSAHFKAIAITQDDAGASHYYLPRIILHWEPGTLPTGTWPAALRTALNRYGAATPTSARDEIRLELGGEGVLDPLTLAQTLRQDPAIRPHLQWALPDEWMAFDAREKTLSDTLYPDQWHLHASPNDTAISPGAHIHASEAWEITMGTGANGREIVAVLDDGFLMNHADLTPQYFQDGMGKSVAKDIIDNDDDPSPGSREHHGTRVLGVACARGDNMLGVAGVCPECRALPIRLFSSSQFDAQKLFGPASLAAEAFRYAAANGARVINNSWGAIVNVNRPTYQALPAVVEQAITDLVRQGPPGQPGQQGVFFAWAVANNYEQLIAFDGWAADRRVFAVGASTSKAARAVYSSIGREIKLLAPSWAGPVFSQKAILTTDTTGDYTSLSGTNFDVMFGGTSAATPQVAGAAALLLAAHPQLSLAQLHEVLIDSADKIDPVAARYNLQGKSCTHGYGRLNVKAALDLAAQRQMAYSSGATLHYELCGDGIDNDHNPATPDDDGACKVCEPTNTTDLSATTDDNCDGITGGGGSCITNRTWRCGRCQSDQECDSEFKCQEQEGAYYCLRPCGNGEPCGVDEICDAGACKPQVNGASKQCKEVNPCFQTNGGIEICDGIDNDCNGPIDDIQADSIESRSYLTLCRRQAYGVCASEAKASCTLGRWQCDAPLHYENKETLCDGLDNDCNGFTDEPEACEVPRVSQKKGCQAHDNAPSSSAIAILSGLIFLILRSKARRRRSNP